MVHKLDVAVSKSWQRLEGENQSPKIIGDIKFQDGIEIIEAPPNHAA
jgi:hypothetical protein